MKSSLRASSGHTSVRCLLAAGLTLSSITLAQVFPPTVDLNKKVTALPTGATVEIVTLDAAGNIYLAGETPSGLTGTATQIGPGGSDDVFVVKLNPTADQVLYATVIGGAAAETLKSIRVDATGNVYLIGGTNSQNFPATTKFTPNNPVGGFIAKLNVAGSALTYATQLGPRVIPVALDVDSTGAVYVGGSANASDLPTTPGVLRPSPISGADPNLFVGFVAKVNASGAQLDLATYYGGDSKAVEAVSIRPNGSIMVLSSGTVAVLSATLSQQISSTVTGVSGATLGFDTTGNLYVAGTITSANSYGVRKYSPDGQTLLLDQPFLSFPNTPYQTPTFSSVTPLRFAVTGTGRMYVWGRPLSTSFPTRNATQTCLANIAPPNGSAGVPVTDGSFGSVGDPSVPDYAMMILGPDGKTLHATYLSTTLAQPVVSASNGKIYAAGTQVLFTSPRGAWNGLVRFDPTVLPADKVSPACLAHAALLDSEPLSPGALMTIFGSHMGPVTGVALTALDSNGKVPFTMGGASVTVDGKPAAMLYAGDTQINFVTPWTTRSDGGLSQVCVTFDNATSCFSAATTTVLPGAFPGVSGSAVLNQDGALNTPAEGYLSCHGPGLGGCQPAARGSTVSIYLTGGGLLDGEMVDGGVDATLEHTRATVTAIQSASGQGCSFVNCATAADVCLVGCGPVTNQYSNVHVDFAGAAGNLVLGVIQVNLVIPVDTPVGPNQLFILYFLPPGASKPIPANVRISVGP